MSEKLKEEHTMQQKITKIIAALLAITLLYANSAAVISYAADNF